MKILIDAMGGDHAPQAPVEAATRAVKEFGIDIVLIGDPKAIEDELNKHEYPKEKITVVEATEVISNYDEPAKAVRTMKGASVVVAANMLKKGEGDAMLSMGSTGALLAAGLLIVGRIKGIHRPALATALPTAKGPKLLLDAGANTNCRPVNLVQFGIMGDVYMHNVMSVKTPSVGLISNGEEEGKGDDLTKKTYPFMKTAPFNFIGNIEGRDIMLGAADVMVCDGFVGNVVLKTVEGMGKMFSNMLNGLFKKNALAYLGALCVYGGIKNMKKMMDYREYGGAPLLGCKRPVIKGHGSSDALAVFNAIRQAKLFVETDVINQIADKISSMEEVEDA